jgi:hypothetical protein
MNKQISEIQTQNIVHLGIIGVIVDEIGIVEKINSLISTHSLEKGVWVKQFWIRGKEKRGSRAQGRRLICSACQKYYLLC